MTIVEIILLAVALAMDCFTVSIVFGVLLRRYDWRTILTTAFLCGLFQALMPLVGWLCTAKLSTYIENVDHWVAFGLLSFLGGRMIVESFRDDDADHHFNPRNIQTQLTFAVATSIDALAVAIPPCHRLSCPLPSSALSLLLSA